MILVFASPVAADAPNVRLVKDIRPGPGGARVHNLVVVRDKLFFVADDRTHGSELWVSDGTGSGTVMVKDIRPGNEDAYISRLFALGTDLFFVANDGSHGADLWKSDGTRAGTVMVKDIHPGARFSTFSDFAGPIRGNAVLRRGRENTSRRSCGGPTGQRPGP